MGKVILGFALLLAAAAVGAQAPVEDLSRRDADIQRSQHRAAAVYRELQQARYELKLAEQDYVNTQDAYRAALQPVAELKRELEKTKKALEVARAREALARKAYEDALGDVDRAWQKPAPR